MTRQRIILAVLAFLAIAMANGSSGASAEKAHTSVIGGSAAAHGTFPYLAFVIREESGQIGLCTGSVVSSNLVLTAAHCVVDSADGVVHSPSTYAVVTGNVEWASPERVVSGVTRIIVNPNYIYTGSFAFWGDAALLQLATPISSPPIKLATTEIWQPGTGAIFAGWGQTTPNQVGATAQLQYAGTVVQGAEYCKSQYGSGFHPVGELCTINPPSYDTGACNGDSGGPLLALQPGTSEVAQIGITSFGSKQCDTTAANVFTRSDFIATWANNRIKELGPKPPKPPPAPKPAPVVPPELPRLTTNNAKAFARQALAEGLKSRYTGRRAYKATCREVNASKRKCSVSWWNGPNDYWGTVTIYYSFQAGEVVWNARYFIRKVNDYCYWYSGHRATCQITKFRR